MNTGQPRGLLLANFLGRFGTAGFFANSCRGSLSRKLCTSVSLALAAIYPLQTMAYLTDEVPPRMSTIPVKIVEVAVNGGADVANPGTTCIRLDVPVQSVCGGEGWIAIKNNNGKLINTALQAKALANNVSIYYEYDSPSQHCPNRIYTPCAVMSIILR